MLKKIPPLMLAVATALALALPPAQNAAAWERVCVHLPFWHAWFSTRFSVVHTFNKTPGKLPNQTFVGRGSNRPRFDLPNFGEWTETHPRARPAANRKESSQFNVRQTGCVSIKEVPNGEPFFVYITPYLGWRSELCKPHPTNPNPWYEQRDARGGRAALIFHAWGTTGSPKCAFNRESR